MIPSLQIVPMTAFHAALRQQSFSSCSIINAVSARSEKIKFTVWVRSCRSLRSASTTAFGKIALAFPKPSFLADPCKRS
jgi:hypothetical protein